MHVAIDLRQYSATETGGTTYAMGLLDHLPTRIDHDLTFVVDPASESVALDRVAGHAKIVAAETPHLRPRGKLDVARRLAHDASPRSRHLVDDLAVDVAHFPGDRITPWRVETPSVISFYGANHFVLPRHVYWSSPVVQRMARANVLRSLRSAEAILVPSVFVESVLVNVVGIDPERIFVRELISWAGGIVDEPADEQLPDGVEPGSFFLFTSSHVSYKNHEGLLRGFAQLDPSLRRRHPLVITGRLPAGFQEAVSELGVADDVRHLGFVDRSTLVALYRDALAYVHPSLYEAGGSFSMFEAAHLGTAVACSGLGSMLETLPVARHFDPYDPASIAATLCDLTGDGVEATATAGHDWVSAFDLDLSVAKVAEAYEFAAA